MRWLVGACTCGRRQQARKRTAPRAYFLLFGREVIEDALLARFATLALRALPHLLLVARVLGVVPVVLAEVDVPVAIIILDEVVLAALLHELLVLVLIEVVVDVLLLDGLRGDEERRAK